MILSRISLRVMNKHVSEKAHRFSEYYYFIRPSSEKMTMETINFGNKKYSFFLKSQDNDIRSAWFWCIPQGSIDSLKKWVSSISIMIIKIIQIQAPDHCSTKTMLLNVVNLETQNTNNHALCSFFYGF